MSNLGRLFFPNVRKEVVIEHIGLLKDKAGNPSIKLAMSMPLDDGKLVGMPSFLGDHYLELIKATCMASTIKLAIELDEMTIYCHTGEETTKPAQTFICPVMNNFAMQRGELTKVGDVVAPVWLEFTAYVNGALEHWSWAYRHFRPVSFYALFLSTQADIEDPEPADPQMKLVPEKDASSDEEFEHQGIGRVRRAVTQ